MSVEFIGYTNVQHAQQPKGSEQCFAAMVSAMTGAPVHEAQACLATNGLTREDGSVGMIPAPVRLDVAGVPDVLEVEPLETPGCAEETMQLMDKQFAAGRAIAFLHRKRWNPEEHPEDTQTEDTPLGSDYHWVLFTGYTEIDGKKGRIHTIDPLEDEAERWRRTTVLDIIKRSNDYDNGGRGVFMLAISNSLGPRP